jgi:MFS family permease
VLVAADVVLALAGSLPAIWMGIALWGLHMGLTQGLLATLVADSAPAGLRGSAFGVMNFATGLAALPASVLAGWLWDAHGAPATFFAGAVLAASSLAALIAVRARLAPG